MPGVTACTRLVLLQGAGNTKDTWSQASSVQMELWIPGAEACCAAYSSSYKKFVEDSILLLSSSVDVLVRSYFLLFVTSVLFATMRY